MQNCLQKSVYGCSSIEILLLSENQISTLLKRISTTKPTFVGLVCNIKTLLSSLPSNIHFLQYYNPFSISDLFVSASIPFRISVYVGGRWLCGSIVCSIYLAAQNVCSLASTVFVTLITFDRYVNVCYPTDTTFAHNFVFSLSATILTWLTSICISIPYVAIFDSFMPMRNDTGSGPHCAYHSFKNLDNLTIFVIAAIRFIVPLTFILAFSFMTVFKLCRLMSNQMGRQDRYRRVLIVLLVGLVCHISCQ